MNCRALALFSISSAILLGQQVAPQDRIAGPVNRLQTRALRGNVHPEAIPQLDAGPADPALKLDHITVMLKRSDAQQTALDELLAEQQNPSSRNYHAWLTPEQYADRFGLSPNDIATVVQWLQSEGLAVDEIARGRNWIWCSGSVGQVQAALRTEIRRYRVDGQLHFANASEPSVPAVLEPHIAGIMGLDDFQPEASQAKPQSNPQASISPRFNAVGGAHYLAPDDFATIYNLNPLYNAGYDGSGQRIAVIGRASVDLAEIRAFRTQFHLPAKDPELLLVPGTADPGNSVSADQTEAYLDIQWAGAVGRNANIIYVYAKDVTFVAVPYAINQNLASIITYSFGLCEQKYSQTALTIIRSMAQQANAQGITWIASSGDSGAAGCESHLDNTNKSTTGLNVGVPASLPEVTGVGGTRLDDAVGNYWSAVNSPSVASALSYIPEKGWNDSSASGLASSGGGLSSRFLRPSWQDAPGVPSGNFRAVPDVSLASSTHDGYLIRKGGQLLVLGGTSAATPAFAGFLALVNQYQELNGVQTQSGQGNINPNLYSIARNNPGVFHDIISGDNKIPCVAATADCTDTTLGYAAGPGYDMVTGLGTVDGFSLATSMSSQWITPAISSLVPVSVIAGAGTFTLSVNGSGFDSGSVVQWMGISLPTTFVSGTQLLATVTGSLVAASGSADVTVLSIRGFSARASIAIVTSFGATFNSQRVTATIPPVSVCLLPPVVNSFATTDTVFLYFNANVSANNLLTREWVAPNGAVVASGGYPPQGGNFCFASGNVNLRNIEVNPVGAWEVNVYDHGSLLFSVPFNVTVAGNQTTPLAHAADGNGFKTTVLLTNTGALPAPYTLRFNDDHGNVPATRFELEEGSLTGLVPAGGAVTIRTAGLGDAIVNGWAELTAPASVGGSVIYSQKTGLPSIQEATISVVAAGSQHFFLPFDNTAKAVTGVAITNPGASAANNISVTFRYSDGGANETVSYPQLPSRNHQAFALSDQFPHTANRSGVAEFTSIGALYAGVFRFNSTGAYTALDVTAASAGVTIKTRSLAHAADGNGFKTTVLLTNAGAEASSYTLRFNDDQGNVPATRFELETGSAPLIGTIPAGGSVTVRTAGLGTAIVPGWAELTAPLSVGGSVIYSQKTTLPSIQEGTATIVAAGSTHFFLPFDNTVGAITSVAVTNPGALPANNIRVIFRYSDGSSDTVSYPQLPIRNHQAFALYLQYPQTAFKKGVAEVTSDVLLSAVVFRFNSTGAFTALGSVAPQ